MYLVCITCGVRNHMSKWAVFVITNGLIEAICPNCNKKNKYSVNI